MKSWSMTALADVAPIVRRPMDLRYDCSYPELGIRSLLTIAIMDYVEHYCDQEQSPKTTLPRVAGPSGKPRFKG